MHYIGLTDGRVTAFLEAESNPDPNLWVESPWEVPPADFDDWLYVGGELEYSPRDLPPVAYTAEQVLTALLASTDIAESLPDGALEHMAAFMQPWEVGKAYEAGELCGYAERTYRCLQAHASQADWSPDAAASLWAKVIASPDIPEWEQPSSTNPYMRGDKVRHNGKVWESLIDNNVWEPSESVPTLWREV